MLPLGGVTVALTCDVLSWCVWDGSHALSHVVHQGGLLACHMGCDIWGHNLYWHSARRICAYSRSRPHVLGRWNRRKWHNLISDIQDVTIPEIPGSHDITLLDRHVTRIGEGCDALHSLYGVP